MSGHPSYPWAEGDALFADELNAAIANAGIQADGGIITGPLVYTATGATTPRSAQDRAAEVVNIKDHGATGNGVTDDGPSIQAALNAASAGNVKTVFFPPSATPYMVGARINVPSNVTLWAFPGTATLKITATSAGTAPLLLGGSSTINILVYGLVLDGNMLGQFQPGGAAGKALLNSFFRPVNVVFDTVTFQNSAGTPLQFSTEMRHCGVRNSKFVNCGTLFKSTGLSADVRQILSFLENSAEFTGSISGTTLTVTAMLNSGVISTGSELVAAGIPEGTTIIAAGTGGVGTYQISQSLTVASGPIHSTARALSSDCFVEDNLFIAIGGSGTNAFHLTNFSIQRNKYMLGSDASFTAAIGGTTMTVTGNTLGTLRVGQYVYGAGVAPGTMITAFGTAAGGVGTYTLNASQTVASEAMTTAGFFGTMMPSVQSYFSSVGQAGPFVVGAKGVIIANNTTWLASEGSIGVPGGDTILIIGNIGYLNGNYGIGITTGISYGYSRGVRNFIVTGNYMMGAGTYYLGISAGLWLATGVFSGLTSAGIANGVVSGNTFSDYQSAPTQQYGVAVAGLNGAATPPTPGVIISPDNVILGNTLGALLNIAYDQGGTLTSVAGGTVTVANAAVTALSNISLTLKTVGGTVAPPFVKTITPGVGFSVQCGASDTSVYNYSVRG